jgi:hypothetical protein
MTARVAHRREACHKQKQDASEIPHHAPFEATAQREAVGNE